MTTTRKRNFTAPMSSLSNMFIASITPFDFKKIAKKITYDEYDMETIEKYQNVIKNNKIMSLPELHFTNPKEKGKPCEIVGHEGRHRMKAFEMLAEEKEYHFLESPVVFFSAESSKDEDGRAFVPFPVKPPSYHNIGKKLWDVLLESTDVNELETEFRTMQQTMNLPKCCQEIRDNPRKIICRFHPERKPDEIQTIFLNLAPSFRFPDALTK